MESLQIRIKYETTIWEMYKEALKIPNYDNQTQRVISEIFESMGKNSISKINDRLNVTMDNEFARAIVKRAYACSHQYVSELKKLESSITYLSFLTKIVWENNFISKREKFKVDKTLGEIKNSKEYKLNNRMNMLLQSDDKEEFREVFFYALGYKEEEVDLLDQEQIAKMYQQFYSESLKSLDRKLFIKIDSIMSKFENRVQILGPLLSSVDSYFGQQIGKDDVQLEINRILIQAAQSQRLQSNQKYIEMLEQQYYEIKKMLDKFSGRKMFTDNLKIQLHLTKFGSIISGFATRNTDMDLTILTNCYIDEITFLSYLYEFLDIQFRNKKNIECKITFIKSARIPLLKMSMKSNKGITSMDLIVNNILGVINSRFLSVYGSIRWVKQLGILIKLWGKKNELIKEEMFSSYSFNLLLIHFLIQTNRVNLIMDARNRDPEKNTHFIYKRKMKGKDESFPVYIDFDTNFQKVTLLKRVNIYEVLKQFFAYYSTNGKYWKFPEEERIITVDGSKSKDFDPNYIFTIKDPFDLEHNPGRVTTISKFKVFSAIDKTFQILNSMDVKQIQKIFVE